jgi:peptidoglycan/xylan/chitin deacetylase (PgdA/CDA1 family)
MYHHIRDFNDPADQIGTNLSVSPEKFKNQLNLINSLGYKTISFNDIKSGNIPAKPIILTFDDGYQNFYDNAYPELKSRKMTAVSYIITNFKENLYMTDREIIDLSNNNIEIGSHTIDHPDLSKISDQKADNEISLSKKNLEDLIGKPVISFCYPSGKFNNNVVNLVKNDGYTYAVTTKSGLSLFDNPLELSRYRVNADTNIGAYLK